LDLAGLSSLKGLICNNNLLTELDVSALHELKYFICAANFLTELSIDNLLNLTYVLFGNPGLNPVNVNSLVNLEFLAFAGGLQTVMDISNLQNLSVLHFIDTNLVEIDISNNNIGEFGIHNNPNLTYVNMKDGTSNSTIAVSECPNLTVICVNEDEVDAIYASVISQGDVNPNFSVTTYCAFNPGGNYNTITGSIVFDANNNGCTDDVVQPNVKLTINDGTGQGASFSNAAGDYIFYTQAGDFTITPQLENPSIFTVSPASTTVNFPANNNSVSTQNFCITANGEHSDAEIVLAPVIPARPGFDAVYKLVYKNTGNQILSGQVYFYYDDNVLDFVSTTTPTVSQSTGLLTWDYSNLLPFESRSIEVTLNLNGPMETPPVTIDDELIFNVGMTPINGNEIVFSYQQTVVGSFDPNDITCLEGDNAAPSEIGNYLHYIVNFENTGTAPAENIVVKIEIDPSKYDVSSLQLLNGSHPVEARVKNSIAEFIFKNIDLETNGHGNILLKVRTKSTLEAGDTVTKKADIFFDYNFPVVTNEATTLFQDLGVDDHLVDPSIVIYPNPTTDFVTVKAASTITSIQVYDIQGRLLMTRLSDASTEKVELSRYSSGIYYLNIATDKGIKTEKILKK
jgi:hypothetical protein